MFYVEGPENGMKVKAVHEALRFWNFVLLEVDTAQEHSVKAKELYFKKSDEVELWVEILHNILDILHADHDQV